MKKTSIFCIVVLMFIQFSCSKQLQNQNTSINSTTNPILKSESTGVTLADATQLAKNFLQTKRPNSTVIIENAQTIVKNGVPYFHVINADKGFVILSPDSVYKPILAYDSVSNFSFEEKNLNPGLKMWLNKHTSELDFVRKTKSIYVDSIKAANKILWQAVGTSFNNSVNIALSVNKNTPELLLVTPKSAPVGSTPTLVSSVPWSTTTNSTVGPLCSSTAWSEDHPFNDYCPVNVAAPSGFNGHDPAGCVPIAIAQVMYFWKYPTTYNWAKMPLTQFDALRLPDGDLQKLIWNVGNGHTNYASNSSATSPEAIPDMFSRQTYKFCSATESQVQQAQSCAENGITFTGLVTNELQNNKRPCIVSGWTGNNSTPCCGILPSTETLVIQGVRRQ